MRHNAAVRLRSSGWTVDEDKQGMTIYRIMNFKEELVHSLTFAFYLMGEDLSSEMSSRILEVAEGFYTCSAVILIDKDKNISIKREDKSYKGKE